MQEFTNYAELILLVLLALLQLGRWSQKTEEAPTEIARDVRDLRKDVRTYRERADATHHKLNGHIHLHTHELDMVYVRRETHIAEHQILELKLKQLESRVERVEGTT